MNPTKQDSAYVNLAAPYESATFRPLTDASQDDDNARIVGTIGNPQGMDWVATSSYNMYVTNGGFLAQRPAFKNYGAAILANRRIDRIWYYQCLPTSTGTVFKYLLMSAYNHSTLLWEMYWWRTDQTLAYNLFTNLRSINSSTAPHWVAFSQGKAYIKGFTAGSNPYGTIIFDGTTGTPTYALWGVPGPTTPVRMSGWTGRLASDITATTTSLTVDALSAPPATPFVIQTGYEQMNVTAKAGAGPYTLTVTRGFNGTTAAAYGAEQKVVYRDWSAPDHAVNNSVGWRYTYAYVSTTGQVSNTVDIERNPDLQGSDTGPFKNLIPKMTIQGNADTTYIPHINIYRTTDGGGTFYFLERINNTGGSITYEDKSFGTGSGSATRNDPVPDSKLDTARVAPTQYSNSPPPAVNPPLVNGVDNPSINATKIVWFQRRFWYAIDNRLYYSSDEEVTEGNPEECWKAGTKGNVIICQSRITSIEATSRDLYVMTATGAVFIIYGASAETGFVTKQIADGLPMGGILYISESSTAFLDRVAFQLNDGRIAVISGETVDIISDPIQSIPSSVKMCYYRNWLINLVQAGQNITHGIIQIYDWKRSMRERRDFWQVPWTCRIRALVGAPDFFSNAGALIGAVHDDDSQDSGIVYFAENDSSLADNIIQNGAWTTELYNCSVRLQPFKLPVGNHANGHAQPGMTPAFHGVRLDYAASQAIAPTVQIYLDNSSTTASETLTMVDPTRRRNSTGYRTLEGRMHQVSHDIAIRIGNDDMLPSSRLDLYRLTHIWFPEAGT